MAGLLDSRDDVGICRAPAKIAAHIFPDLIGIGGVAFLHTGHGGHDLPWSAIAALEAVIVDEGLLHRVQLSVRGQTFDRGDLLTLDGGGKGQAGQNPLAVHVNGASAALALIATLFAAGKRQMLSEGIEKGCPHIEIERAVLPVDPERHGERIAGIGAGFLRSGILRSCAADKRRRHCGSRPPS